MHVEPATAKLRNVKTHARNETSSITIIFKPKLIILRNVKV